MKTSKQVGTLTALIAAMALVGCSDAQEGVADEPSDDAQVITLSYAFFAPAQSFPAIQMEHWAKELNERTDGRVEVDLFPGGSLLTASSMYDGVLNGVADIGLSATSYEPGRFPLINLAGSLTGQDVNSEIASRMTYQLIQEFGEQMPELEEFKVITAFTSEPAYFQTIEPTPTQTATFSADKQRWFIEFERAMAIVRAFAISDDEDTLEYLNNLILPSTYTFPLLGLFSKILGFAPQDGIRWRDEITNYVKEFGASISENSDDESLVGTESENEFPDGRLPLSAPPSGAAPQPSPSQPPPPPPPPTTTVVHDNTKVIEILGYIIKSIKNVSDEKAEVAKNLTDLNEQILEQQKQLTQHTRTVNEIHGITETTNRAVGGFKDHFNSLYAQIGEVNDKTQTGIGNSITENKKSIETLKNEIGNMLKLEHDAADTIKTIITSMSETLRKKLDTEDAKLNKEAIVSQVNEATPKILQAVRDGFKGLHEYMETIGKARKNDNMLIDELKAKFEAAQKKMSALEIDTRPGNTSTIGDTAKPEPEPKPESDDDSDDEHLFQGFGSKVPTTSKYNPPLSKIPDSDPEPEPEPETTPPPSTASSDPVSNYSNASGGCLSNRHEADCNAYW